MHVQYQKGIPPTVPKDPIDDHETYTVWKEKKEKKKKIIPSLPTAFVNKSSPTLCYRMPPQFTLQTTKNLHTIHKIFTLTHSSLNKFKFAIHLRYAVAIRRC